ncbi:aromatic acid exporter family protein [Streptomyces sp. NPDC006339]|uniref:FUSC family protein n=1 Tax=Streptomyces sp. NPDC006339 TaxID=3156755 RepID=UPI0033BC3C56
MAERDVRAVSGGGEVAHRIGSAGAWCRRQVQARWQFVCRAVRGPGEERDGLLLQCKGAAAAAVAWCVAAWLLPPTVRAFAPFTALLALQSTVYRSLWDSVQYLGAMALGTAGAAAFGSTVGVHVWSVGALAFIALIGARSQLLGRQGAQVPVVALFAFAGGGGEIDYIGHLVAAASIGVCCGLVAHFAVAPSPHTETAQHMTADLAAYAQSLLRALARTAEGETAEENAQEDWARRSEELATRAVRVRAAVDREQENTRLNPRRPWSSAGEPLHRCHEAISMIERLGTHIRSTARALTHARRAPETGKVLTSYARMLDGAADALECLRLPQGPQDADRLRGHIEDAMHRYHDATTAVRQDRLDTPGAWPVYGTALTEAVRILEEIEHLGNRTSEPCRSE